LQDEPFVFAAHASIAAEGLNNIVAKQTFFHFMPQTGIGKLIAKAMSLVDRPSRTETVMLDNIEAIMGCVKNGLGYTLLPAPDVHRYANDEVVKFRAPNDAHRSLILVTRSENILTCCAIYSRRLWRVALQAVSSAANILRQMPV